METRCSIENAKANLLNSLDDAADVNSIAIVVREKSFQLDAGNFSNVNKEDQKSIRYFKSYANCP